MRRIHDHGRGCGYFVHHAPSGHVAAQAPDARLHQRVAFDLLVLVANLLLAHLEVLLVSLLLPEQIHRAKHHE